MDKKKSLDLINYIIKNVSLVNFLETEIGCRLKWTEFDSSAVTICPMPNHKDKKPSFRLNLSENGVWIYYCFGCRCKGNIIHFCMDYYNLSKKDSINFICEKFKIKDFDNTATKEMAEGANKAGLKKKAECANINTSNQCFDLLRKDYKKYNVWVAESYKRMNKALDELDVETIESIGYEASIKMQEKS